MVRIGRYLANNAIGFLALFIALGGVSYAAVKIPPHSVGTKQLKAHAVGAKQLKASAVGSAQIRNGGVSAADLGRVLTSRVRTHTTQYDPSSSSHTMTWDAVDENAGGFANLSARPTALQVTRPGVYLVNAETRWHSLPADGRVNGCIRINRADGTYLREAACAITPAGDVNFLIQPASAVVRLAKGQLVTLETYQDSSSTIALDGSDQGTWLSLTYLGR